MQRRCRNTHPFVGLFLLLATVLALSLVGSAQAQQDEPPPAKSLQAASYPVFALDASVEVATVQVATIQVTEGTTERGARIVVSLHGTVGAPDSRAVLYFGDCGPDREIALELTPFDVDDDPLSSVTEEPGWTFERLTESDLFAYLFDGDVIDRPTPRGLDGNALGCGEVGLAATQ